MRKSEKLQSFQRHQRILTRIQETGTVSVSHMAEECGVSEMTVRRDLDNLAGQGLVDRTHGGATLPDHLTTPSMDLVEPGVDIRAQKNRIGKQAIAKAAFRLIEPRQTIGLDVGSTILELARLLTDVPLNLHTYSVKVAAVLAESRPSVYLTGGRVMGMEPSVVGAAAIHYLERLNLDIAFIGASGIATRGLYDYSVEDSDMKRAMVTAARQAIALIDSTKFEHLSVTQVCGFDMVDILVTDRPPPAAIADALAGAGTELIVAEPDKVARAS